MACVNNLSMKLNYRKMGKEKMVNLSQEKITKMIGSREVVGYWAAPNDTRSLCNINVMAAETDKDQVQSHENYLGILSRMFEKRKSHFKKIAIICP